MTRAPATMASSDVAAYPCSAKSSSATSTRARLVEAEYRWRRLGPVDGATAVPGVLVGITGV